MMIGKWLAATGVGLAILGSRAAAWAAPKVVTPEMVQKITAAAPDKPPAEPHQARKVLVYTQCSGFYHASIPVGARCFEILGRKSGAFEATVSDDPVSFDRENLARFDAIVMMNNTGELFGLKKGEFEKLPADKRRQQEQWRTNLLEFVSSGKGLVGIHAATDLSYTWAEYGKLIGGYFNGHPWIKVVIGIDDPASPINAAFNGQPYAISDEIYTFKEPYSRKDLRILLSVDLQRSGLTKGFNRPDNDYAVSWIRTWGKGRVFYCSLGHKDEVFWNPVILRHYLAGTQFALGDLEADSTPSGPLPATRPVTSSK